MPPGRGNPALISFLQACRLCVTLPRTSATTNERSVINLRRNAASPELPTSLQRASTNMGFHPRPPAPQYLTGEDTLASLDLMAMGKDSAGPLSPVSGQSACPPQALPRHTPWVSGAESYFHAH